MGYTEVPEGSPAHLVALVERKVGQQSVHKQHSLGACTHEQLGHHGKKMGQKGFAQPDCEVLCGNGTTDPSVKAQSLALGMAALSGHGSSAEG